MLCGSCFYCDTASFDYCRKIFKTLNGENKPKQCTLYKPICIKLRGPGICGDLATPETVVNGRSNQASLGTALPLRVKAVG